MNFPILSAIIFIPLIGAFFIFIINGPQKIVEKNSKYVAIFSSAANFLLALFLWYHFDSSISDFQFVEKKNWIQGFVNFQIGVDGISILFIVLTTFLTPICVFSGIESIKFKIDQIRGYIDKNNEFSPDVAGALCLYARYLKRIAAHSRNLISSIVNPFERIGYPE